MDFTGLENELLQDTTEALPSEEEVVERTYSNVYGQSGDWDKGAGDLLYADHEHYNQNLTAEATVADLQALYDANTDMQGMFGDFETYLSYMDERQDLIDSGVAVDFIGTLGEQQAAGEEDQAASAQLQQLVLIEAQGGTLTAEQATQKAELEAAGVVPSLGMPTQISGGGESVTTPQEAYDAMMANEEMAALNEKYGIPSGPYQNDRGDTVMWTGSGQVVHTPYNKSFAHDVLGPALFQIAASVLSGPAATAMSGLTGAAHSMLASAISTIVGTGGTGGDLSLEGVLKNMAMAGASTAIMDQVKNAIQTGDGILADIGGWVEEQTDKLFNQKVVTMPDGTTYYEVVGEDGWPIFKDAAGNTILPANMPSGGTIGTIEGILGDGVDLPEIPDWVWNGAETVVDVVEAAEDIASGNGTGPNMGEGGATTLPDLTPDVEVEEEQEEEQEEEVQEILEEEEEEPILPPEVIEEIEEEEEEVVEEVVEEEEVEEEVVDISDEDPEKDGGIIGSIFDSIFGSVPDDPIVEEEEETVVLPPEVVEEEGDKTVVNPPEDFTPPPVKDDDFNDPEEEDEVILPPEIGTTPPPPPPGVVEPPGGGGSPEGGLGDGTDWSELFRYTNIKNPELSKYAPTMASVRSMFNELS